LQQQSWSLILERIWLNSKHVINQQSTYQLPAVSSEDASTSSLSSSRDVAPMISPQSAAGCIPLPFNHLLRLLLLPPGNPITPYHFCSLRLIYALARVVTIVAPWVSGWLSSKLSLLLELLVHDNVMKPSSVSTAAAIAPINVNDQQQQQQQGTFRCICGTHHILVVLDYITTQLDSERYTNEPSSSSSWSSLLTSQTQTTERTSSSSSSSFSLSSMVSKPISIMIAQLINAMQLHVTCITNRLNVPLTISTATGIPSSFHAIISYHIIVM
jgi:hypothetical protein